MIRGAKQRQFKCGPIWDVRRVIAAGIVLAGLMSAALAWASQWLPLASDGLHDPAGPAIALLQEPGDALSQLPGDTAGNKVRWVRALKEGVINPRTNLYESTDVKVLDLDILMSNTGAMPVVLFPHDVHTAWLDCSNCHERIFVSKAGATPVNMFAILQGEYCGRCHGAVSFPLTECNRCHSVPRNL